MNTQGWFQKNDRPTRKPASVLPSAAQDRSFAAKLRPRELIAMLTHHYARARQRSLPRVNVTVTVANPLGKQAVTISFDRG